MMQPLDPLRASLTGARLIEASAGTGKTHTITVLVLRLLLEHGLEIGQILVVTYTRAATAELRDRIRRRLADALRALERQQPPEDAQLAALWHERSDERAEDRMRLMQALADFDVAPIFTIHGFCQRVLSESTLESGTPFDVELVEDTSQLVREVALDRWTTVSWQRTPDELRWLRAGGLRLDTWAELALLGARAPGMPVLPERAPQAPAMDTAALREASARAAALWERDREQIIALLCEDGVLKLNTVSPDRVHAWSLELDGLRAGADAELVATLAKLTPDALRRATRKGQRTPEHPFFEACSEIVAAYQAHLGCAQQTVIALHHELIGFTRREVAARKRTLRVQGFDDLLGRLHEALEGPLGAALAARTAERYPAVLVDEFQDTDPLQYAVFRRLHQGGGRTLLFIGDPKQAIYGFRGADVFAYMRAKQEANDALTLGVNYRSDPSVLASVNHVFGRLNRAFLEEGLEFSPVQPRPGARDQLEPPGPALQVLFVSRSAAGVASDKVISAGWCNDQLPHLVAREVLALLRSGSVLRADEGGEPTPVAPRHIAVLCRTNKQGRAVQQALAERGVPAALDGDSSVFMSESAEELVRVLSAMAQPADGYAVRAALATALLGCDAQMLLRLRSDDAALELWLDRFARVHQLWLERGFVQAMHALLDEAGVQARLLARRDGQRRLTDALHVVELLHAEAIRDHLGPLALVRRLQALREGTQEKQMAAESAQLRLESDEHAVRITTVHRSKGLEYPIVFCPFLHGKPYGDSFTRFHDETDDHRLKLDLGSPELDAHRKQAQREEEAEAVRLAYVALTRAKHRSYVLWGAFNGAHASALAHLLHTQATGTRDVAAAERIHKASDEALRAELESLCACSAGAIGVRDVASVEPEPLSEAAALARAPLVARTLARPFGSGERFTSFSRLTRFASAHAQRTPDEGKERDAEDGTTVLASPAVSPVPAATPVPLAELPAGPGPGTMIHAIYENIDFRRGDPEQLARETQRQLRRGGFDERFANALALGIDASLRTPLDPAVPGLSLGALSPADRLDELEITLALGEHARFSPAALSEAFARFAAPAAAPEYAHRLAELSPAASRGFLRGFIDLVFRHEGRYYVVDYKSNRLGATAAHYRPELLTEVMGEHHYFLQYHLYVLALHRYLRARIADYSYERCFGGVYYLFVRGMSPDHAPRTGVFADRPPLALIEALEALVGGPSRQEAA